MNLCVMHGQCLRGRGRDCSNPTARHRRRARRRVRRGPCGGVGSGVFRRVTEQALWGLDFDPGSNVVGVYVRYLRAKIGADRIETVRGMGYRLV